MVLAETSGGVLRGQRLGAVNAFRGVPYAEPPIGPLRWRSPRAIRPWAGERDASAFGPIPPQDISLERLAKRGVVMSEDCLSLNLWTPGVDDGRRPVVAFLHGGGVVAGSASAPLLDGGALAARGDVVVVTIGFRLGALGSLLAPSRIGDVDDPATNIALRDQLMALHWIRDEIAAFGGDPGNVTVAGQSSGAVAIACMLAMPDAAGLFDRAILQSGGLERVRSTEAAAAVAARFLAALDRGVGSDHGAARVEEILAAQATVPTGFVPPVGPWHHAVDGDLVRRHPLLAADAGGLLPVPVLAGTTAHEWRAFDTVLTDEELTDGFLRERARALAGDLDLDVEAVLERYDEERREDAGTSGRRAVASALVTDFHFGAPTEQLVRAHAAHGHPVHHYELGWRSPRPGLGACHDLCLPLLFGTMDRAPALAGTGPEAAAASEVLQDAWLGFIREGDPSTDALGPWPAYEPERRPTMLLGPSPRVAVRHRAGRLAVWQGRYPVTG